MGYTSRAVSGISWIGILRFSTRGISFLRIAILARILSPSQFGVFGVASLILALLETLTETGINVFLIQEKEDIKKYLNSAWIVSIIRGCLIALILILSAPIVVNFFHSPQSYPVIILIAFVPFIRGFINPGIIKIQKEIEFQKEFYLRLILFIVDALVVIFVAFITRSAESFAYGLIASAIVEVILSFILFKPLPSPSFELEKIKLIIKRGWWVTITGIFSYTADNGDNIFVGRILNTSSLGIYQVAYKLSTLTISEVTDVVNKVTFPIYSKFSEDRERLRKAFYKVTAVSSGIAIVVGFIIFIFANEIISIVLGKDWESIVSVIRVLAFYGILRTVFGNFSALFLSMQKQDFVAKMTFVRVSALLVFVIPLINLYGLNGAGYAMIISIIAEIPVIILFTRRLFGKITP